MLIVVLVVVAVVVNTTTTTITTTTTVIDPLYLLRFLPYKKKMENVGLFPEFQNYKMAATSCFIFSFSLRSKRFRLVSGSRERFSVLFRSLRRNSTETLATQATLPFSPRYFDLCTGFALATRDCPHTNVTSGGGLL